MALVLGLEVGAASANQALLSATKAKKLIRLELSVACEGCLGRALLVLAQWSPS